MKNNIRAQVSKLFGCTLHDVRIICLHLNDDNSIEWAYGQIRGGGKWIFENGAFKKI